MPDLFHGDPVPLNRPAGFDLMTWLKGPPGHLVDRVEPVVQAVVKDMKSSLGCERIGAIGYCFGVSRLVCIMAVEINANPMTICIGQVCCSYASARWL